MFGFKNILIILTAATSTCVAAAAEVPSFSRDIRPLLSDRCLKCHGPDDKGRKGDLRLDLPEAALKGGKSGEAAIVPGKVAESEILRRMHSTDPDEVMPPPAMKKALTADEIKRFEAWIAAGAKYEKHWSFEAPVLPTVPAPVQPAWPVRNEVDAFVQPLLIQAGLTPAAEAERTTLLRRVSFDLTGLPPALEETTAYLEDASPQAYERAVDRLLASPRYGEKWARKWLDLARYADTNGYEKDRPRTIWPYRDWVIRSLNADLPFNQFSIEQIAGDLLPHPTTDQLIATGFHRNSMQNEEGGIDPLEFRYYAMVDRVATTSATWLGLTLQCAQCHTHKYDPVTHHEYFSIMAFLNNADEPELELPDPAFAKQEKDRAAKLESLLAALPDCWLKTHPLPPPNALDTALNAWVADQRSRTADWKPTAPASATSNLPYLAVQPDASVFVSGDITKADIYQLQFTNLPDKITAVRLEALPDPRLPAFGPGMAYYEGPKGDFFLGEFQLASGGQPVKFSGATESYSKNSFGPSATALLAIDGNPETGWSCAEGQGRAHEAVFILAQPLHPVEGKAALTMAFGRHFAASLGKFRISFTTSAGDIKASELPSDLQTLLTKSGEPDVRARLSREFLLQAPELAEARKEIDQLRTPAAGLTTLVMSERPAGNPRPTFMHNRGEYTQPTDRVEPGVLSVLNPLPPGAPADRLSFARWLVSRDQPLTARVVVNRAWAAFFGRGLVKTQEDFGYQGELPSHPALLDWLAVRFMDDDWSLKKLHRLIVLSHTYRQSSSDQPAAALADPENQWLWRGPRLRLDAEEVRDAALQAAGLLSGKMFGPGVYPPQPASVTTEGTYGSLPWKTSTGEDRSRRSLYTFAKRTAPFAFTTTFDAPVGDACIVRRDRSNTPLQALSLLNDVTIMEAASAFGKTLAARPGPPEETLLFAYRNCFSRAPAPDESALLLAFFEKQLVGFNANPESVRALTGNESTPAIAAWTLLSRTLLNLDEFVTKN